MIMHISAQLIADFNAEFPALRRYLEVLACRIIAKQYREDAVSAGLEKAWHDALRFDAKKNSAGFRTYLKCRGYYGVLEFRRRANFWNASTKRRDKTPLPRTCSIEKFRKSEDSDTPERIPKALQLSAGLHPSDFEEVYLFLAKLKPRSLALVKAYFFENLSMKEASASIGVSEARGVQIFQLLRLKTWPCRCKQPRCVPE